MYEISFTPLAIEHFPILTHWLKETHLSKWWGDGRAWSESDIKEKYLSYTQGYKVHDGQKKPINAFVVSLNGRLIGYIQHYNAFDFPRNNYHINALKIDTTKNSSLAALDFYIGCPDHLGKGFGALVLERFLASHVFPAYALCLVDPERDNRHAIRAYSKAGFMTHQEIESTIIMIAKRERDLHPLVILGSSRSDGRTQTAIKEVIQDKKVPIVDLQLLKMSYYDYAHGNKDDDFLPLANKMIHHQPIILATPVYWYSMSAIMKTFIDRWSDLVDSHKDLGCRLAGKDLYVITSYAGEIPKGFEDPFSQTCDYLQMNYKGCFYYYTGEDPEMKSENKRNAERFARLIWNNTGDKR